MLPCIRVEADDLEYWQYVSFTEYEQEKWKVYSSAEFRFKNHYYNPSYVLLSPIRIRYKLNHIIDLEAHYCFIESRSTTKQFLYRHRFEFEVNPTWKLSHCLTFNVRNRYELIKQQETHDLQQVYRCRPRFIIFCCPCCSIESWSIYDEIFYNISKGAIVQNRFVPVEITIKLSEGVIFSPFLMWQSKKASNVWHQAFVLGSKIDF